MVDTSRRDRASRQQTWERSTSIMFFGAIATIIGTGLLFIEDPRVRLFALLPSVGGIIAFIIGVLDRGFAAKK